jgi:HK97 family phage portal protein
MLALRTANGHVAPVQSKSWPLAQAQGVASRSYWRPQSTMQLLGGGLANYDQLYWSQPWVFAAVNKLVRSISRLDMKTYSFSQDGKKVEAPKSAPAKVFRAPYPRAGQWQWKEFLVGSLCIWGNATFVKFRGGNGQTPIELWPMPFQRVTVIEGRNEPIVAYQYMGNNTSGNLAQKPITFLPEDVVHFSYFNPDGHPWGRSPLEALQTTLALENAGQRYALSSFGNAARPASFIKSENRMTTEQKNQLRAEIDAAYGGPDNAFKVALLDAGLDWQPIGGKVNESGLIENRQLSREEVCAVFDIPPPLVGILDNATYSNISEQHVMLYMTTIAPILTMIEDTITAQFLGVEQAWDGQFAVKFDMGDVVRGDYDKRTQGIQREFMAGSLTPNEAREIQGRSPHGDPDDKENPANWLYVPVNTAPVTEEGIMQPVRLPNPSNPNPRDPILSAPVNADPNAETVAPANQEPSAQDVQAAETARATGGKSAKPRRTSQAKKIEEILTLTPAH